MDNIKFVYTFSSKKGMFDMLIDSIDSLEDYIDSQDIIVFATPPREEEHIERLNEKGIDVRKRENFGEKISTTGFSKPSYYGNKYYLTEVDSENIVFLDCDTILRENPKAVLKGDYKIKALPTNRDLDKTAWEELFNENGIDTIFSTELNAGFLIFKDRLHKQIKEEYGRMLKKDLHKPEFGQFDAHDQYALSLALGANQISTESQEFSAMGKNEHSFDKSDNPVCFHKGSNESLDIVGKIFMILNNRFIERGSVQSKLRKTRNLLT